MSRDTEPDRGGGGGGGDELQHQRTTHYAECTFALRHAHAVNGAAGVFDQALTNGLLAIVARSWPGEELRRGGGTLPARDLLAVIEEQGERGPVGDGEVAVLDDPAGPLHTELPPLCQADPLPNFTVVKVDMLRAGLAATQPVRHGRAAPAEVLTREHVAALALLDRHPALRLLGVEAEERHELQVEAADRTEFERAVEILLLIGEEELRRRQAVDYRAMHRPMHRDDHTEVQECPVCGSDALIARYREMQLDEIGIGTCAVCGYRRSLEVARAAAEILQIERAVERAAD